MTKRKYLRPGRPPKNKEEKMEELLKNKVYTQVSVRIPSNLHEKIRIYSIKNKVSVNKIILELLEKIVSKKNY